MKEKGGERERERERERCRFSEEIILELLNNY